MRGEGGGQAHVMQDEEFICEDPWRVCDDLIHPLAVAQALIPLLVCHHCLTLQPVRHLVVAAADLRKKGGATRHTDGGGV